jgi:hypothetical protein
VKEKNASRKVRQVREVSTPWKPNSAGFPRHGTHFRKNFHGMEPTFVPVGAEGENGSREVRKVREVFHAMEACFGTFPRHGTLFRKIFHTMEHGFAGFPHNGSMFSTPWKTVKCQVSQPAT